ncbi:MAG: LysM peptidoglycan-binding domain-containing protein [Bacillota bacterium]
MRGTRLVLTVAVGIMVTLLTLEGSPSKSWAAHFGYRELAEGMTGEDVCNLQIVLQQLGYYSGEVSGRMDGATKQAVFRFQLESGLKPTGKVDGECLKLLSRLWEGYSLVLEGYQVSTGETLETIARNWQVPVGLIKQLNRLGDEAIVAGQRLILPVPGFVLYRVEKGDTLWKIARKYGVSVENIVRWNKVPNPNRILVGELLLIFAEDTEGG